MAKQFARPCVMFIDDRATEVWPWERLLERAGFRVKIAKNAQQAIDYSQDDLPEAIFVDLQLNGDGYHCREELVKQGLLKDVTMVLFTNKPERPGDQEKAIAAGFAAYVEKPFRIQQLIDLMLKFIPKK